MILIYSFYTFNSTFIHTPLKICLSSAEKRNTAHKFPGLIYTNRFPCKFGIRYTHVDTYTLCIHHTRKKSIYLPPYSSESSFNVYNMCPIGYSSDPATYIYTRENSGTRSAAPNKAANEGRTREKGRFNARATRTRSEESARSSSFFLDMYLYIKVREYIYTRAWCARVRRGKKK